MCKVTTFFADSAPYETETDSPKMFFADIPDFVNAYPKTPQ